MGSTYIIILSYAGFLMRYYCATCLPALGSASFVNERHKSAEHPENIASRDESGDASVSDYETLTWTELWKLS